MKKPGMIFKVLTVVSSVLLVAGFIGYRAGAFDWILGKEAGQPERFMSGSKFKMLVFGIGEEKPPKVSPVTYQQPDPTFMSSSKYFILVSPSQSKETPAGSPSSQTKP